MPVSVYDFVKGLDFTGLTPASGADFNKLLDDAAPYGDKGIILYTVDTALNTPDVPDAGVTAKWVRYIWLRIPFAGAAIKTPIVYAWNDDLAVADPVYKKWFAISADISSLTASLAATDAIADSAKATADALWTQMNGASGVAGRLSAAELNIQVLQNTGWKKFTSTTKTIPADGSSTIILDENHGLPGIPQVLNLTLVCNSPDIGYLAGDEVNALAAAMYGEPSLCPFTIRATATKVAIFAYWYAKNPSAGFYMPRGDNTNGATGVDQTKWSIRATAIYFA